MKRIFVLALALTVSALAAKAQDPAVTYAKTDFVPGDEIFFEDTFEKERLGEFPLRWDLLDGYVETTSLQGRKVLSFTDNGRARNRRVEFVKK